MRFEDQTIVFDRSGSEVFALESAEGGPLFWPGDDQLVIVGPIDLQPQPTVLHLAETPYTVVDLSTGQPTANAGDDPDLVYEHFTHPDAATERYWSEFRNRGEDPPPLFPAHATGGSLFMLELDARAGIQRRPRKIGIGVADSVFIVHILVRWAIPSLSGDNIDVVLQP